MSTEADERGDAGIISTPHTEIDLMCRLSLVDYLTNHLGREPKSLLYEAVFAMDQDEKASADKALAKAGLWPKISALLREITALDPACGSGSFIVGMLHILNDLTETCKPPAQYRGVRIRAKEAHHRPVTLWR